jgi:antitoxin component of MazEF toxin-antitoxin module
MVTRKIFRTSGCVVLAIPRVYRDALQWLPGTEVTVQLKDRALVIARAIVTPESVLDEPDSKGAPIRG